jgi:hypothetical protein
MQVASSTFLMSRRRTHAFAKKGEYNTLFAVTPFNHSCASQIV